MELIDRGDHIYFELLRDNSEFPDDYYMFTYKYIRYVCRCNYSYRYKYSLYWDIINKLNYYFNGEDVETVIIYKCIGSSYGGERGYVEEVICINGLYRYYVLHRINELDKNMINSINKDKYNLDIDNIKILNYHDEYWDNRDKMKKMVNNYIIDRSIKFAVKNDDSQISRIFE